MPLLGRRRANWTPGLLALSLLLNVYFIVAGLRRTTEPAAVLPAMTPPPAPGNPSIAPSEEPQAPIELAPIDNDDPRIFSGRLDGSIAATLGSRLPAAEAQLTAAHLARSLAWQIDLRGDPRPGDPFRVVYRYGEGVHRTPTQGPGDPIEILSYEYRSLRHASTFRGYRFQASGDRWAGIWDENGVEVAERLKRSPIDDYEAITARLRDGRGHKGIDFKVPVGTPVRAPMAAKVLRKNWNVRSNGYCIDLMFEDSGLHGLFLHLSNVYDDVVTPGRRIEAGTVIALSGNTGRTTNPHLHYALRRGKESYLDPFRQNETMRRRISAPNMPAFDARRAELDDLMASTSEG
ncbi:MAG: hypothetical protein CME06_07205 [Gemmatimonadetes bacterium]|nr:hypothetical protein [Gemmatimonadota bacterium]